MEKAERGDAGPPMPADVKPIREPKRGRGRGVSNDFEARLAAVEREIAMLKGGMPATATPAAPAPRPATDKATLARIVRNEITDKPADLEFLRINGSGAPLRVARLALWKYLFPNERHPEDELWDSFRLKRINDYMAEPQRGYEIKSLTGLANWLLQDAADRAAEDEIDSLR